MPGCVTVSPSGVETSGIPIRFDVTGDLYLRPRGFRSLAEHHMVAKLGLGTQAWLGIGPFDRDRVEDVPWPTEPIEKPDHAFLTSSWDEERKTSHGIDYQGDQAEGIRAEQSSGS